MARTKEFDVDQALDRAVEVFWEKGYEGASMRELEERMQIGRQSLYDTFGDKRQLFLQALDRYAARNGESVKATLMHPDASLPQLRAHFDGLVIGATPRGHRPGCMMTSAILEMEESDTEVSNRCRGNERAITRAFAELLTRAKDKGEVRTDLDVASTAVFLVGQVYGLIVLSRNGASRSALQGFVEHVFATL